MHDTELQSTRMTSTTQKQGNVKDEAGAHCRTPARGHRYQLCFFFAFLIQMLSDPCDHIMSSATPSESASANYETTFVTVVTVVGEMTTGKETMSKLLNLRNLLTRLAYLRS